jgi:hypothetical protein
MELEGVKVGVDMAKHRAQMARSSQQPRPQPFKKEK